MDESNNSFTENYGQKYYYKNNTQIKKSNLNNSIHDKSYRNGNIYCKLNDSSIKLFSIFYLMLILTNES